MRDKPELLDVEEANTEVRGPTIPTSVAQITNYGDIEDWVKMRGFVDEDDIIIDIQFSVAPSGVMRIDDIEVEQ